MEELERKAKAFDWLAERGFATSTLVVPSTLEHPAVHSWWSRHHGEWRWTCQWVGSEYPNALAAVEAAMLNEQALSNGSRYAK